MLKIIIVICILLNTICGDNVVKIPGDFVIGALLRMRSAFGRYDPSLKCEKMREIHGMQRLEAALLTLDQINNDTTILPGVTLGMEIHDICSSETSAFRESLFLVQNSTLMTSSSSCQRHDEYHDEETLQGNLCWQNSTMIGVIGPDSSERTIQVQNLLKLFHIPQIGYTDNAPELDNKSEYWTYLRIIPSDTSQTKVIRDILKKFNWTYVATVSTKGVFNHRLYEGFRSHVEPNCHGSGICIAKHFVIGLQFDESTIDDVIYQIADDQSVNVVICFCMRETLHSVLESTKRLNLTDRFTFIASDRWRHFDRTIDGVEEQAWGSISVSMYAPSIPSFSNYYTSLKPSMNTRNPWFKKFWEEKFQCTLPIELDGMEKVNSDETIQRLNISAAKKICTGNESLAETYYENRKIGFVMKAIWAMAHGLHNMMTEVCGINYTGVCPEMYPVNTSKLLDHLMNLSFRYNNELVTINNGNSALRYDITNYQKLPNGTFGSVYLGDWRNGTLKLHEEYQSRQYKNVISICSLPCPWGHQKIFSRGNDNQECCWECEPCDRYTYFSPDKQRCIECPVGKWTNANRTGCDDIPVTEHSGYCPTTLIVVSFAVLGLIGTLFTFYVFIKYKDTPVVKASSRELCYVILISMILAHTSVFILLMPRTSFQCALSRSVPAITLTMMFAGLFTKTHRIARILVQTKSRFPKKKYRLMSTSACVVITFSCVAIEIVICAVMLLTNPPEPALYFPTQDRPERIYLINILDVLPPTVVIIFLQSLCIFYAIKTRNVPRNFNEAKFIGFAMFISFLIFIATFTMLKETVFRSQVICSCLTLNASTILIFLFYPKLYIIIVKPEQNRRALFITNKNIRTHFGSGVDANIVESVVARSTGMSPENNSAIGNSCRLRRTVAVQTSSKLLRNLSSFSGGDDDESLSDDNFTLDNDRNTLPESDKNIVATVNNNHERKMKSRGKFSPMRVLKSFSTRLNPICYRHGTSRNNQFSTATSKSSTDANVSNILHSPKKR